MKVQHTIGDFILQDNNIFVEQSDGLLDIPKIKKIEKYDWAEADGHTPDLSLYSYTERKIRLKCWVRGKYWEEIYHNFMKLKNALHKTDLVRLRIDFITPSKLTTVLDSSGTTLDKEEIKRHQPLFYEVYCEDDLRLQKTFRDSKTFGAFTLDLIEPKPIKVVYQALAENVEVIIEKSDHPLYIYWGDGNSDFVVNKKSITHTYKEIKREERYILIYGKKDVINNQIRVTNSSIVWRG